MDRQTEATMSSVFWLFPEKRSTLKEKNFAPLGANSREQILSVSRRLLFRTIYSNSKEIASNGSRFDFRVDVFSEGVLWSGKQTGSHKSWDN